VRLTRDSLWVFHRSNCGSPPLFFGGVDALLDGIGQEVLGQVSSFGDGSGFAGSQNGADGSG
jgi:hypothetical protein